MSTTPTRYLRVLYLIAIFSLSIVFWVGNVQAATTGKIIGRIMDDSTGEPVIQANVVVGNKQWGAASDLNGEFIIINLPPGLYEVKISCLNYHDQTIKDVYIASDLTTELNIKLTPAVMEMPDVVVIYKKPQVELGQSTKEHRFDKEKLENLRPEDVSKIVQMTTGFKIDPDGKMHVRGSRAGDVAVIIEGVDMRDPLVDTQINLNLSAEGIDEVTVQTGGFSSEYGKAMGGVIQVTTAEGKPDHYSGRVEYITDRIIQTYSHDSDRMEVAFGGPVPFTKDLLREPITFYITSIGDLTNTYIPFDVTRPANDYLGIGIDIPERQRNDFSSSLKLAYNLNNTEKISFYLRQSFLKFDIYPLGEGAISGNYGYGYKHNIANRPYAWNKRIDAVLTYSNQLSAESFFELKLIANRNRTKVQPRGKSPGDFTMMDEIENELAPAFDRNQNGYLEDDEYLDSDGDGFMDGFWDANGNGIFDGGGEGYEDLNMNGRWDRGEDWVDLNRNGIFDGAEPWIDVVNPLTGENNIGVFDSWDTYADVNGNGRWDPAEPQLPEQDWNGNGFWDGERFIDANGDGQYNPWESWQDLNGNYLWDPGEPFIDVNGNGVFDCSEGYDDMNRNGAVDRRDLALRSNSTGGFIDDEEPFIDGDYWWNTGEPFIDEPDPISGQYNGVWDPGEIWFDLSSSASTETGGGVWFVGTEMTLNGRYDGPNFFGGLPVFDEYELFTRPADWNFNSDRSRPITYTFNEDMRGSDWPDDIFALIPGKSTWINRTLHDKENPVFDMRNFVVDEDKEWFLDYNGDGHWNNVDYFLNEGLWDPTAFWQDRTTQDYIFKFSYQNQVSRYHQFKGGIDVSYHIFTMQEITQPDLAYNGEAELPAGSPWPERGGDRDFYEYRPVEGAVYVEDLMEFEGLKFRAGLRSDFVIHPNKVVDEFRDRVERDEPGAIVAERSKMKLSPRLGISHPITEQSKLYFNYGHFYQAPKFTYFYQSATANFEANSVIGNPNLEYEKTIEYELGVETQISDYVTLDVSGYYKDQYDMISTIDDKWKNIDLDRYANIDYGRTRGFELSIDKQSVNHYALTFNYTFSFAYGKASDQHAAQEARLLNTPYNFDEHPLDWDETHSVNAFLTLNYGRGEYPRLFGLVMPDDWQATLQWEFGSGLPYKPSIYTTGIDDANLILDNSARQPWHERTTLKFEKYYTLNSKKLKRDERGIQLIFGLTVRNLFNKLNVQTVHAQTGSPTRAVHPSNPAYNPGVNRQEFDANPRNYEPGRNVLLRVGMSF